MAFSLDQFYRLNRRILIWIILFALLWLLHDFFSLIFLTFALAFIANPLIQACQSWLHMGRRISIVLVYLFFLITLGGFVRFVAPALVQETKSLLRDVRAIEDRLLEAKNKTMRETPMLDVALTSYLRSSLPESAVRDMRLAAVETEMNQIALELRGEEADGHNGVPLGATVGALQGLDESSQTLSVALSRATTTTLSPAERLELKTRHEVLKQEQSDLVLRLYLGKQARNLAEKIPVAIQGMFNVLFTLGLALLFSFLISMDISRLGLQVRSLSASRLRDFYQQTAQPVVRFAYVVGRAIQAQALIALVNTVLTMIGLIVLGIPNVALLSVIVFVCSFIPVLGVFISIMPTLLFAINAGGFSLALGVVVMVCIVHAVEAYLLNPLIYGQHLEINPVIVLIILFVGHHAFGVWGMLLGVPVAHYFIHDVFGVPIWDERKLAAPPGMMPNRNATATQAEMHQMKSEEGAARPE